MKTNFKILVISAIALISVSTSCQKDILNSANAQYASVLDVSADGTSTLISQNMQSAFVASSIITDSEIASLLKMKGDEKLARDIYAALNQKWGSTVFARISLAENNHLNAINQLLKYYGSADTLISEAGTFADANLQTLYNDLLTQGSGSLEDAYKTGALIEEMDIKDLSEALNSIMDANITMVYENLEKGSRNHLRSFYKQLTTLGIVYTPVYISQEEYDQIVNSTMEKGKMYKMNGRGNQNGACDGTGKGKMKG